MGMVCSGMFSSSARLLQTFVCGRESLALVAPSLVVAAWLIGAGLCIMLEVNFREMRLDEVRGILQRHRRSQCNALRIA